MSNITNCNFEVNVDEDFAHAVTALAQAAKANADAIKAIAERATVQMDSVIKVEATSEEDYDE